MVATNIESDVVGSEQLLFKHDNRTSWKCRDWRRIKQISIDGGGKGLRRLFWGLRSYGNSWCGGPKRQQFRRTSAIEAHNRGAE